MLLDNDEIEARLESPDNIINRFRSLTNTNGMGLFGVNKPQPESATNSIIGMPPSASELIKDIDSKLNLSSAEQGAKKVLHQTLKQLELAVLDEQRADKLANVAGSMSKILNSIDEIKHGRHEGNDQVIIYKPVIVSESHYESIHVVE